MENECTANTPIKYQLDNGVQCKSYSKEGEIIFRSPLELIVFQCFEWVDQIPKTILYLLQKA